MTYDFCVIGGGIVGLATALKLLEARPGSNLLLLEKESDVAIHQTGRNSGVIHAGIYYVPGSLKAELCRRGLEETKMFCQENDIRYETCGKLIVATNEVEKKGLDVLFERAFANRLDLRRIDRDELQSLEPNITGIEALLSTETGMVNYADLARSLKVKILTLGATVKFGINVNKIKEKIDLVEIVSAEQAWTTRQLAVCGGLQADRLARMAGLEVDFKVVPFRGEYFRLPDSLNGIVKHHIYPVPDPAMPFLGIHLTRMIDGFVTVGPNAVLGFSREGYSKFSLNISDVVDYSIFPGFWKLMRHNSKYAFHELKSSLFKSSYLIECQKYCPKLKLSDLQPYQAGIRAQIVLPNGTAAHDFLLKNTERMLHVCNAPSPAATSAFPIASMIASQVLKDQS